MHDAFVFNRLDITNQPTGSNANTSTGVQWQSRQTSVTFENTATGFAEPENLGKPLTFRRKAAITDS